MSDYNLEEIFAKIFQEAEVTNKENVETNDGGEKEQTKQISLNEKEQTEQSQSQEKDSPEVRKKFEKELELIDVDKQFYKYFDDYCKISYLQDIKNEDVYLINRWKFIFYHCVMLDGLFQKINIKNKNIKKKVLKNGKKSFANSSHDISSKNSGSHNLNEENSKNSDSFICTNREYENGQSNDESKNDSKSNIICENKTNEYLNQFKLKEAKEYLKIYDSEIMNGNEFEFNCKRVLKIMMIFIQRDNYILYSPSKIPIQKIMGMTKIKDENNVKINETDCFEIDVLINNFKIKDFNDLIENFPKQFLLGEKLEDNNNNINIFAEISRNVIRQIKDKSRQIKIYNIVFKAIERLKHEKNIENKNYILSKLNLENINNDNYFLIVTDGYYTMLNYVINLIKKIKEKKIYDEKSIKDYIKKETEKSKLILEILTDGKFRFLDDLIYDTYQALVFLNENNIKYGILFVGDNDANEIENFYKQIKGNPKKIKVNFIKKIKELINDLICHRNELTQNLEDLTKSYYKTIFNSKSSNFVFVEKIKNSLKIKSNYFKIDLKVILLNKNISINDNRFNITASYLSEKSFNNNLENILKNNDFNKLYVFINNNDNSKNKARNENVLIINEKDIHKFYQIVVEHIQCNQSVLDNQIKKKVIDKISNIQTDNSKILNYDTLIKIFENDEDFSFDVKSFINIIEQKGLNIKNTEDYISSLRENKKKFEKILSKKFVDDFEKELKNNFKTIKENIVSSIIFDFLLDNIELPIYSKIYEFYEKK